MLSGWLDTKSSNRANRIRKLRNQMVHSPKKAAPKRVYEAIIETKEVVECLLT
jgi:uncharacterized protein YutE (UPF0331/DUF86 family)